MQNRILVLFAHPLFEKSRIHKRLLKQMPDDITFHDLYQEYPHFNIDIEREKDLLLKHDIIIWQHPIYWYSCPALLKQWIDVVLEVGWAYGPTGKALEGKWIMQAISSGGSRTAYQKDGYHQITLGEFLSPFRRTTTLCNMQYLPPFVAQGSHRIPDGELNELARDYGHLLTHLQSPKTNLSEIKQFEYANDWLLKTESHEQ